MGCCSRSFPFPLSDGVRSSSTKHEPQTCRSTANESSDPPMQLSMLTAHDSLGKVSERRPPHLCLIIPWQLTTRTTEDRSAVQRSAACTRCNKGFGRGGSGNDLGPVIINPLSYCWTKDSLRTRILWTWNACQQNVRHSDGRALQYRAPWGTVLQSIHTCSPTCCLTRAWGIH